MKLPDITTERLQAPQPSGQVVVADTSAVPQAIAGFGKTVSEIGEMVHRVQVRRNTEAAEAAFTQARQEQIELASGEGGYLGKLGKDATSDTFHKDYIKRYDDKLARISDGLQNDDQREQFKARANISRMQVSEGLLSHTMRQDEAVFKAEYASTMETEQKFGVINALNPTELGLSRVRIEKSVNMMAERFGLPKEVADSEKRKQLSGLHEAVVNTMIQGGYDLAAQQYATSDQVKADLTKDAQLMLAGKIKEATTAGKAFRAVEESWTALGPQELKDPVRVFEIEKDLRKKLGSDTDALQLALSKLREKTGFHHGEKVAVDNANNASVIDMDNNKVGIEEIRKSDEYLALSPLDRRAFEDYRENRGYTERQRAEKDAEDVVNPDKTAIYWAVRKSPEFETMKPEAIMRLQPHIGTKLVNDLMSYQARPDRVQAVKLENQMVETIFDDVMAGTTIGKKAKKAALGALGYRTKIRIDEQQRILKRELDLKEKEDVIREVADEQVMVDYWNGDEKMRNIMVPADKRGDIYVPLYEIPNDEVGRMIGLMRSRGRIQENISDKAAMDKYKESLQKAYGRFTSGGTQQDVLDALDGR